MNMMIDAEPSGPSSRFFGLGTTECPRLLGSESR